MERRPVPREPPIDGFLESRDRRRPVSQGKHRPAASELSPHAIDRRGPLPPAPVGLDDPGCAIGLLATDSVAGEDTLPLIGDCQHTAGPVAPADPARHPGSNASSPVEKQDEVRLAQANITIPHVWRVVS